MTINTEYKDHVNDLVKEHIKIVETGMETCPWCGQEVPVSNMTASVSRGVICFDCDMQLASN